MWKSMMTAFKVIVACVLVGGALLVAYFALTDKPGAAAPIAKAVSPAAAPGPAPTPPRVKYCIDTKSGDRIVCDTGEVIEAGRPLPPPPTWEQTETTSQNPYEREEGELVLKLEMVHDNHGASMDQCALILRLRMNAQEWGNAEHYRMWSAANAEEFLFERDVKKAGLDLKSKKDEKKVRDIAGNQGLLGCS